MDLRKLKTLIDLVSDSNVSELEITEAEGKVRIVKGNGGATFSHPVPTAVAAAIGTPTAATTTSPESTAALSPTIVTHNVKSPMVGTFYRSASPGAKSFVEIGDSIKAGETICIIEAMKILNEIESDKSGVVTQVHCENGQAVEYGQPLFTIE
ncbi:MAG: acetyl-CoA carboxylase biotin carboxyl carrier protein [Comamonadaceae bacterium]